MATLASRVLGLIRDIVIAGFYGAGLQTDAFFVAFKIPNLLRRLVAEGALASAFVPVFTDQQEIGDREAKDAIRACCGFTLVLTTSLTLIGIFFADQITALFAPGFVLGSDKFDLASELMRMMFPYIVMVSLLSLASAVLNVLGYFALPAFAPAILNISLIVFALAFSGYGIASLAWGVLAGGVLALVPQIVLLKRIGYSFLPTTPFGSEVVAKLCKLMAPAVLSASVYQFIVFINTLLASFLTEGSISWLYYADRLFQFPLGVFSIALATALLPALARSVSKEDYLKAQSLFNQALGWVSFITIPAAFGLALLSDQLVNLIYSRGSFDQLSVENTASALVAYSIGLWAVSVQTLVIRMYLARKNTLIPALVSVFSLCCNLFLALTLMGPIPQQSNAGLTNSLVSIQSILPAFDFGHDGLALAGSLTAFLTVILLACLLPKIGSSIQYLLQTLKLLKAIASSLAMTLAIYLVCGLQLPLFLEVVAGVIIGAIVYGICSILLKSEEALQLTSQIKSWKRTKK